LVIRMVVGEDIKDEGVIESLDENGDTVELKFS
jgi:hypothetical protein